MATRRGEPQPDRLVKSRRAEVRARLADLEAVDERDEPASARPGQRPRRRARTNAAAVARAAAVKVTLCTPAGICSHAGRRVRQTASPSLRIPVTSPGSVTTHTKHMLAQNARHARQRERLRGVPGPVGAKKPQTRSRSASCPQEDERQRRTAHHPMRRLSSTPGPGLRNVIMRRRARAREARHTCVAKGVAGVGRPARPIHPNATVAIGCGTVIPDGATGPPSSPSPRRCPARAGCDRDLGLPRPPRSLKP